MGYTGRYNPADFIVPPALGKGESQRIVAYVQNEHKRALNIVARSGVFPFEMETDVIRWCILYGLQKLASLEPQLINSHMRRANMMLAVLKDELVLSKHREWMDVIVPQVRGYLGRGEVEMAKATVRYQYAQTMAMPEETDSEVYWKSQWLKVLEENFKELLPHDETEEVSAEDRR